MILVRAFLLVCLRFPGVYKTYKLQRLLFLLDTNLKRLTCVSKLAFLANNNLVKLGKSREEQWMTIREDISAIVEFVSWDIDCGLFTCLLSVLL